MSWLDPMEPDDALSQLLTDWRGELDAHADMAMSTELPALPGRSRRWLRAHQRTAAATAIVVALAGTTSVAAAATGSSGPLGGVHDLLYGKPASPPIDYKAIQARHVLDEVEAKILEARQAGAIRPAERARLSSKLDTVQSLLDSDPQAPDTLATRLATARGALAAIPAPAPPTPSSPHRGVGHHDTSGGAQPSTSGEDNQGSDGGQGDDRGGSQGSDDGSQDGTDGSSSDGGDSTSGGGGDSTSGGGDQTDSGGGDDGSGSGDQGDGTSSGGESQTSSDSQSDDGGSLSSDSGDGGGLDESQATDG